ncbi:hypothetical protein [uncultured Sphingomonas sp.]|uniref:hypothetical protein n=1 Tax=uncultured Sphingomonas sp. TaxID=158754 RepID=UPI002594ECCE|nr:hypothetical protein [uncultured Sphingomonas sp.]
MANRLYPTLKEKLLGSGVNFIASTIKAQLIDAGVYTYADAHSFLAAVPAGARIGNPITLANKSITSGIFDAADGTFTSVPAGTGTAATVEALILYRDTGDPTTSDLIAYIDVATGLPFTPDGGNANVTWPGGGIFNL